MSFTPQQKNPSMTLVDLLVRSSKVIIRGIARKQEKTKETPVKTRKPSPGCGGC